MQYNQEMYLNSKFMLFSFDIYGIFKIDSLGIHSLLFSEETQDQISWVRK